MGESSANQCRSHQEARDTVCGGLEVQALHTTYQNTDIHADNRNVVQDAGLITLHKNRTRRPKNNGRV
jgi:hypothetical protein